MATERTFLEAVPYGATYLSDTAVEIASGDPVAVITRVAAERAADLIVCGTRARTALARMFLGSTAAGRCAVPTAPSSSSAPPSRRLSASAPIASV